MKTIQFSFNTEYARELRGAIHDRQKQSVDIVHEEKEQIKGSYYAWSRTCAAMDRLEDTIDYLNQIELGKNRDNRSAFDFYDFINSACIVIDCIRTIGRIFRIDDKYIAEIENSTAVFGNIYGKNSNDQRFFEYIRSLCAVHPLCTNRQSAFLNGNQFHCCPYVTWEGISAYRKGADLTALVYPSNRKEEFHFLDLYVSQFERYLEKWIDLIPKIIEAKNNYTDKEYERLRNKPVKSLSDYPNDIVRYLEYLRKEYRKRFDYGNDYLFDRAIRIFTVEVSDRRNAELLEKYRNAVLYSLQFAKNELQNMSFEGYENNGIQYPDPRVETTLFDELCDISPFGSSFSKYTYNLEKLYYLEEDYHDYYDKRYARKLLEEAKGLINQYVYFSNSESDEETIVLVNLALYLEALSRKCLLNKNIPNDLTYRITILSKAQQEDLVAEEKKDENHVSKFYALRKWLEEQGGQKNGEAE